jgi:apolipoprotein D and lipocalin family protein
MKLIFFIPLFLLTSCTGIPEGIKAVENFEVGRYLGKWYEIARLDHSFERDLNNISAEYSLKEDGGIKVVNTGFNTLTGKLEQAEGKAYFTGKSDIGSLKVSFFGLFYGGYHIIELDKNAYQYAMVTGPDRDYLWILARNPKLEPATLKQLVNRAKALGFAVEKLIFPEHRQHQKSDLDVNT